MRAHSSVEGFYSPLWTYMRLDCSPRLVDSAVLYEEVPFGSHLRSLQLLGPIGD